MTTDLRLRFALVACVALASAALATAACSSKDESTTTTADGGATSSSGSSGATGNVPAGALEIVINEMAAVGSSEWIEIANKGSAAFDLTGFQLADSDKTTGEPKTADAMKFPAGASIAAGGKVLVLTGKKDQPVGPHPKAECLANGPDTCFYAGWGVSSANGEQVHLLGKDGAVIASTAYPRNVGIDVDAGQTACRLPDMTGEFSTCKGTPGSANAGP